MAATDARPVPIKNTAYRAVFPIYDNDGDLVTGAAGLDSEVSKDQGTFTDCTNEATEIATSSGLYYLDLTSTEMNADCVAVIVKTSTTNAKTTVLVFYPQESGDIKVDLQSIAGSAVSTSSAQLGVNVVNAAGTAWGSGAITAASIATNAITATKIAADAIGASQLATDAVTEIQSGLATAASVAALPTAAANADAVWDEARAGHVTAGSFGEGVASVQGNVTGSVASVTGAVGSVTGNVGGNVTGSIGSLGAQAKLDVNAEADTALTDYDAPTHAELVSEIDAVQADIAALNNLSAAQVNAEVVDALNTDTYAEPGQESPGATVSLAKKIGYIYKFLRNKITQTSTTLSVYADDATTVDQKATISDDGTTYTRGEIGTGP